MTYGVLFLSFFVSILLFLQKKNDWCVMEFENMKRKHFDRKKTNISFMFHSLKLYFSLIATFTGYFFPW